MSDPIAVFTSPGRSMHSSIARVQLAERLGYDAAFTTHIAARDSMMVLAALTPHTSTIKLGTGVLPAFPRHPIALAQEAATLDELSGGRLILGIGPSHKVTTEGWYGISMEKAFSRMVEYTRIVRSIFTTDGVRHEGEFYRVQFGFLGYGARKDLPIYLAALGPKMLRFSGAEADGVILWGCMPSYIRDVVVPNVRAGAEEAGRDPKEIQIVAAIPSCVTENPAGARDALRADFFTYMTLPFYRRAIAGAGFEADIEAFDKANASGDMAGALQAMSDDMLSHFGGIGDGETVRAKIAEYRDAGVTLPAVAAFPGGDGSASIEATIEAAYGA